MDRGARHPEDGPRATGRGARRRSETRARLIAAAREVMARKGLEAASIREITDAADVGFGSFYNHFSSKAAIAEAVMDEAVDDFGRAADRLAGLLDDSAEVLAASVRHGLRRAADDPAWGWFLVRTALVRPDGLGRGLGPRVTRDVDAGVRTGRFVVTDRLATVLAVGGAAIALIAGMLQGTLETDAPERAATVVLRLLGLPDAEAREVARRPLPPIDVAGARG